MSDKIVDGRMLSIYSRLVVVLSRSSGQNISDIIEDSLPPLSDSQRLEVLVGVENILIESINQKPSELISTH